MEDVIETAARWAVEEAKALLVIRDERLYQGTHPSFEAYVVDRWKMERAHAYRLCSYGEVITALSPFGDIPERETHARPLYGLTPDQQRGAWKLVERRLKGRRTATDIEGVVKGYLRARSAKSAVQTERQVSGKVIVSDAIEAASTLTDGTVSLALFSPPYAEQRAGHYPGIPEGEMPEYMAALMAALMPKMLKNGNVLIVAREHLRDGQISDVWLKTRLAIRAGSWIECEEIIWHKPDAPPTGRIDRPRRTWERIMWFSPSRDPFVNLRACGKPLVEDQFRLARPRSKELPHSDPFGRFKLAPEVARVTDLVTATVGTIAPGIDHPAMFPVGLADQLVRTFSPDGGLVADLFCGSGSSLLAARDAGRNWWGCDIVPAYVALAESRLND